MKKNLVLLVVAANISNCSIGQKAVHPKIPIEQGVPSHIGYLSPEAIGIRDRQYPSRVTLGLSQRGSIDKVLTHRNDAYQIPEAVVKMVHEKMPDGMFTEYQFNLYADTDERVYSVILKRLNGRQCSVSVTETGQFRKTMCALIRDEVPEVALRTAHARVPSGKLSRIDANLEPVDDLYVIKMAEGENLHRVVVDKNGVLQSHSLRIPTWIEVEIP